MLNSQIEPKKDGSTSAINDSYSMSDKDSNNAIQLSGKIDIQDNDPPKKYGLSLWFSNFVCCSCFTTEHSNHKYKITSSDNNAASKSLTNDINGKGKKSDNSTEIQQKTNKKSKSAKDHENEVVICSPPAQSISASSNGNHSYSRDLKDGDSQNIDCNNQTSQFYPQNEKLLPVISAKNQNKKCFIIDLDETLVHSSFKFVKTAIINVNVDIDGIQHEVFVCKRPYVDEFLAELGDLFECVLFTASLGKYADPVTNFLDPNGVFEARLFREACAYKDGNYIKDLDAIGRDVNQIVILDNSPVSYLLHPKNALQIVSWFDDPTDTALRDLIPYFKDMATSPLTVVEWLELNRPPESAAILGYPPSNLHWILMQTLSVPEAVAIYMQRLRESYHASGSSNVSRESSTRAASNDAPETHVSSHHSLITQAIKISHRKSLAIQEDDNNRPPVSSPVAIPSSDICLDDDLETDGIEYSEQEAITINHSIGKDKSID